MKSAAKGAESAGAEVEYVDLYKMDLHGCMNCLICKQEDKVGKCYWKDEVSPLIERILDADCLLIGVPVFFTQPTSHYIALMERLIYCIVSYKTGNSFKGKINVGLFYTLNYPVDYFDESVRPHLKQSEDLLKMFNGNVEIRSFKKITKREYSNEDDESIKSKENELDSHLRETFNVAADLCR